MTKILADIPDQYIQELDQIAVDLKKSRAELIRQSIKFWLCQQKVSDRVNVFGILKGKNKIDAVRLQRKLREEW